VGPNAPHVSINGLSGMIRPPWTRPIAWGNSQRLCPVGIQRGRCRKRPEPEPLRASGRIDRRAHDVPRDDGKELEASIDFRNGQRCSISGAFNQSDGFVTRGSVIGAESISSRASAVINQRAVFFTCHSTLPRLTEILGAIGKETLSRNQRQVRKPGHGFLYDWRPRGG
jgi:hypothetical protein